MLEKGCLEARSVISGRERVLDIDNLMNCVYVGELMR